MQSKNNMKRKGFTLVELLIVIVVIGILSAMMMLSSTEAVTSAKASNVVSNLRNMKTAALALFVDKLDDWESTGDVTAPNLAAIEKYMNSSNANTTAANGTTTGSYAGYGLATTKEAGKSYSDAKWYVFYTVSDKRVSEKLEGRAKSVGLLLASAATDGSTATIATGNYVAITGENTSNIVAMEVR